MTECHGGYLRQSFIGFCLLALVLSIGFSGAALAAAAGDNDKAKIQLVDDFCNSWNEPETSAKYLASDSSVRLIDSQPALKGPSAVVAALKGYLVSGTKVNVKTLSETVHGPVVINTRIDTLTSPGKPKQVFRVVGVFLIRNGKIKEWTDYLDNQ